MDSFKGLLTPPEGLAWSDKFYFSECLGETILQLQKSYCKTKTMLYVATALFFSALCVHVTALVALFGVVARLCLDNVPFYFMIHVCLGEGITNKAKEILRSRFFFSYTKYLAAVCQGLYQAFFVLALGEGVSQEALEEAVINGLIHAPAPGFNEHIALRSPEIMPLWSCYDLGNEENEQGTFSEVPEEIFSQKTQLEVQMRDAVTLVCDKTTTAERVLRFWENSQGNIIILGYQGKHLALSSERSGEVVIRGAPNLKAMSLGRGIISLAVADAPSLSYFCVPEKAKSLEIKRCPSLVIENNFWGDASKTLESVIIYACNQLTSDLAVPSMSLRELAIVCCPKVSRIIFPEKEIFAYSPKGCVGPLRKLTLIHLPHLEEIKFPARALRPSSHTYFSSDLHQVTISCCARLEYIVHWLVSNMPVGDALHTLHLRYLPRLRNSIKAGLSKKSSSQPCLVDLTGTASGGHEGIDAILFSKYVLGATTSDYFFGSAGLFRYFVENCSDDLQFKKVQELIIQTPLEGAKLLAWLGAVFKKNGSSKGLVTPVKLGLRSDPGGGSHATFCDKIFNLKELQELTFVIPFDARHEMEELLSQLQTYLSAPALEKVSIYTHEMLDWSQISWPPGLQSLEIRAPFSLKEQQEEGHGLEIPVESLPVNLKWLCLSGVSLSLGEGSAAVQWLHLQDLILENVMYKVSESGHFPKLADTTLNSIVLDKVMNSPLSEAGLFLPKVHQISVRSLMCVYPMSGLLGKRRISEIFYDIKHLCMNAVNGNLKQDNWVEDLCVLSLESLVFTSSTFFGRGGVTFRPSQFPCLKSLSLLFSEKYFSLDVEGLSNLPALQECFLKGVRLCSPFSESQKSLSYLSLVGVCIQDPDAFTKIFRDNYMLVHLHYQDVVQQCTPDTKERGQRVSALPVHDFLKVSERVGTLPFLRSFQALSGIASSVIGGSKRLFVGKILQQMLACLPAEYWEIYSKEDILQNLEKGFWGVFGCGNKVSSQKHVEQTADLEEVSVFMSFWAGLNQGDQQTLAAKVAVCSSLVELFFLVGKYGYCCNSACCPGAKENLEVQFLTRMFSDYKEVVADALTTCVDRFGLRILSLLGQMRLYMCAKSGQWDDFANIFYTGLLPLRGLEDHFLSKVLFQNAEFKGQDQVSVLEGALLNCHQHQPLPEDWHGSVPNVFAQNFAENSLVQREVRDYYMQISAQPRSRLVCGHKALTNHLALFTLLDKFACSPEVGGEWTLRAGWFGRNQGAFWRNFSEKYKVSRKNVFDTEKFEYAQPTKGQSLCLEQIWRDPELLKAIPRTSESDSEGVPPGVSLAFMEIEAFVKQFAQHHNPINLLTDPQPDLLTLLLKPVQTGAHLEYSLEEGQHIRARLFLLILLNKTEGRGISFNVFQSFYSEAALEVGRVDAKYVPMACGTQGGEDPDAQGAVVQNLYNALSAFALFLFLEYSWNEKK